MRHSQTAPNELVIEACNMSSEASFQTKIGGCGENLCLGMLITQSDSLKHAGCYIV